MVPFINHDFGGSGTGRHAPACALTCMARSASPGPGDPDNGAAHGALPFAHGARVPDALHHGADAAGATCMQLGVRGGGGDFPAMLGSRRFHSVTELAEALRVCPPLRACQLQAADGSSLCAQALLDRAMHGSHPAAVADGSPVRLLQVAQAPVPAPMLARQTQVDVRAQRVPETSAGAPAVQPTTVAA